MKWIKKWCHRRRSWVWRLQDLYIVEPDGDSTEDDSCFVLSGCIGNLDVTIYHPTISVLKTAGSALLEAVKPDEV